MLLKEGRENGGRPAHCVGMVRAPETVEVANFLIDRMGRGTLTAELLQPDELVAGIIAQVIAPFTSSHALTCAPGGSPTAAAALSARCREHRAGKIARPIHMSLARWVTDEPLQLDELVAGISISQSFTPLPATWC